MTGSMGLEIRGIRRIEPREPRSLTVANLLVLVGGVGISLAIRPFIPVSHWLIIAEPVVWFLLAVGLTTSLAILEHLMANSKGWVTIGCLVVPFNLGGQRWIGRRSR